MVVMSFTEQGRGRRALAGDYESIRAAYHAMKIISGFTHFRAYNENGLELDLERGLEAKVVQQAKIEVDAEKENHGS